MPLPPEQDEELRPYLGQPILDEGASGLLLGPWQRFDSQHYLRIARQGYANEAESVFPPLYPLAVRALGSLAGGGPVANLTAAILISNLAFLGLLILLHRITEAELGPKLATRTLVYLTIFPTGFFLLAPYTESLFILLAVGSIWAARKGRFWLAGGLGLLASLTRLTGWILVIPLVYEWWRQNSGKWQVASGKWQVSRITHHVSRFTFHELFATALPGLGTAVFLLWRWWAGLPSLAVIYEQYWFQTTGFPGQDLGTAVNTFFFGGTARAGEFTLVIDFLVVFFLLGTTIWTFRRLGATYGLYSALLLLFMLLPASENYKPLYSFSRYALAFFPTFMLLGLAGERPWLNRLILYPSIILYLYFSGQFFIWGWVA
ncbi:MAG: mannosyltransferase family protein [Anaerolineae bacterium]